jgi:hypothetical protein
MDVETIVSLIVNNGVAVGLLAYFVYRDNKFMNQLTVTLTTLQKSVDSVKRLLEKNDKESDK